MSKKEIDEFLEVLRASLNQLKLWIMELSPSLAGK